MERERRDREKGRAFKLIRGGSESLPDMPYDVKENSIIREGRPEVKEERALSPGQRRYKSAAQEYVYLISGENK